MIITKEVEIGGKKLSIETGRFAKQSNGAVMVSYGDTMVLVTVVASKKTNTTLDYFPLSVEYKERYFAAGKFPGGFIKREGRPTEKEILSGRLIDRPIRPLFPSEYNNDTQIAAFVYSFDGENDPDVIAAVGASAALAISDIPFLEPIGEVRVGRINGEFIVNPTVSQIKESDLELTIAGTETSIMMVEGESLEASEDDILNALKFAHVEIVKIIDLQKELVAACGLPKMVVETKLINQELVNEVNALAYDKYKEVVYSVLTKEVRYAKNDAINAEALEALAEKYPEDETDIKNILHDIEKDLMRKRILEEGVRLDGRNLTEIRQITSEVGIIPRTHASALFTRGETQSLTTVTLGTAKDEQIVDGLGEENKKAFYLHYNFPPFSVGETGRYGGQGRREIGHGNLAERALKFVVPSKENFPYTIRINSDILESNGSSSMATVCAGSLAMMDAGIPVKKAISGIAMGLVKEGEKFAVLSDILGNEDHLGDMDFKVAGSVEGITAIQMDIKIQGISFEIMEKALAQAKDGRMHILGKMNETLAAARESISPYAPSLIFIQINPEKIGAVIGQGGKIIQGIQRDFNVEINIEEDGKVAIAGVNIDDARRAKDYIKGIVTDPEIGMEYVGKVIKIADFGAFVEFIPGVQGLLHISQIALERVNKVSDFLKEGDIIPVKLLKMENGKYSLSRKALLEDQKATEKKENISEIKEI
ncbi:MAG: polyribonucleotide nucleotidyltransferase [Ignavibacteriales bacterium CG18_big_fil_WC_8_21_14_2_50_31_20]|nr:MAG: polyribonucleotide nucleotidyltransferase [Ignavibacteriales bacterium CG18_big_fil_WC_8_21_14_2_50_31_20]